MAKTHEPTKKQKFVEGFSSFLSSNKLGILIFFIALIAVIAGMGIAGTVRNSRLEKSAAALEALEADFTAQWASVNQEEVTDEVKADLTSRAEALVNDYPGSFAAQRGLMLLAGMAFDESRWEDAAGFYGRVADGFPESYLAPVALMNGAAALEEAGKPAEASALYRKIVDNYGDALQESLRASFNAGRLAEEAGDAAAARAAYEWVIEKGGQDPWAMLAQSRLLTLKS